MRSADSRARWYRSSAAVSSSSCCATSPLTEVPRRAASTLARRITSASSCTVRFCFTATAYRVHHRILRGPASPAGLCGAEPNTTLAPAVSQPSWCSTRRARSCGRARCRRGEQVADPADGVRCVDLVAAQPQRPPAVAEQFGVARPVQLGAPAGVVARAVVLDGQLGFRIPEIHPRQDEAVLVPDPELHLGCRQAAKDQTYAEAGFHGALRARVGQRDDLIQPPTASGARFERAPD